MNETLLRIIALDLAVQSQNQDDPLRGYEKVVKAAEEYFSFLSTSSQSQKPSSKTRRTNQEACLCPSRLACPLLVGLLSGPLAAHTHIETHSIPFPGCPSISPSSFKELENLTSALRDIVEVLKRNG